MVVTTVVVGPPEAVHKGCGDRFCRRRGAPFSRPFSRVCILWACSNTPILVKCALSWRCVWRFRFFRPVSFAIRSRQKLGRGIRGGSPCACICAGRGTELAGFCSLCFSKSRPMPMEQQVRYTTKIPDSVISRYNRCANANQISPLGVVDIWISLQMSEVAAEIDSCTVITLSNIYFKCTNWN